MSPTLWNHIDNFLNTIATTLSLPRESLVLTAELRTKGPTVQPGPAHNADKPVEAAQGASLPSAGYDSLSHRHIQYEVIQKVSGGETGIVVPKLLYTFQHHPLPGCCRFCINRWVKVPSGVKGWTKELSIAGLNFRRQLAASYGYSTLYVSSGPSFSGSEVYDQFQELYSDGGRRMFAIPTKVAA